MATIYERILAAETTHADADARRVLRDERQALDTKRQAAKLAHRRLAIAAGNAKRWSMDESRQAAQRTAQADVDEATESLREAEAEARRVLDMWI